MNSIHIISQDVFDKIRSRFSNLEMGDDQGGVTSDPKEARFFDFDFTVEGNNLGRVSISINELGSLKIFYSQGILEDTNDFIHDLWYDFLREMRMFAKRRLLRFDTRDITKSNLNKDDFQYLANTGSKEDNMQESKMFGSSKSSYLPLEKTKLIVRHNSPVDNEQIGSRSRKNNIKALYIENSDGERFKYPFIHLAGAKAMQRHCANGGRPYDELGSGIINLSEKIAQLSAFKRHVGNHDGMNREVNEITSRANMKLEDFRKQLESICKQNGYQQWKDAFQPGHESDEMVMDQATMEDYKSKFTISSFKEDLAQYFPLLHSIMRETGTVDLEDYVNETQGECKECHKDPCQCDDDLDENFNVGITDPGEKFEEWADRVAEGRLEPDTLMDLKELLDNELSLGVDGVSAIEALQGIGVHNEELESALVELSKVNPEADPKETIGAWLSKEDPEAAKELGIGSSNDEPQDDGEVGQDGENTPEVPQEEDDSAPDASQNGFGLPKHEVGLKEIAEMVNSFYDKTTGKFPKGETGVVIHVKKELGDRAGILAEKLVAHLTQQAEGSIQGGVWTADAPKKGAPNVPVPQDIDGASAPLKGAKIKTIEPGSAIKVDPNYNKSPYDISGTGGVSTTRIPGQGTEYKAKEPGGQITTTIPARIADKMTPKLDPDVKEDQARSQAMRKMPQGGYKVPDTGFNPDFHRVAGLDLTNQQTEPDPLDAMKTAAGIATAPISATTGMSSDTQAQNDRIMRMAALDQMTQDQRDRIERMRQDMPDTASGKPTDDIEGPSEFDRIRQLAGLVK